MKLVFCLFLISAVIGCNSHQAAAPKMELLSSPAHEALGLPFSEVVRANGMLYLSGQIGARPGELNLVSGGVQAETRQAMRNIESILKRHNASLSDIVKCTIFIADMADWPKMNEAYLEVLGDHRPARSALGANGLALNGNVEIECIAVD